MAQWWSELAQQVRSSGSDLAQKVSNASALDGIPFASQSKSLVQVVSGNSEGARHTQDNFTKRCPGVSQLRSALERQSGDDIAAMSTKAEFDRSWREADEAAKAALAPIEPIAQGIAKAGERVIGPVAQQVGAGAEQVMQRARSTELGKRAEEVGSDLARRIESGAAAADRAATSLYDSDLGHRFSSKFKELLAQHSDRSSSDSCGASSSSTIGPIHSLDKYTILAEAAGPQCGVQCSCCLETVQEGEAIRVLPCFHSLHHHCAEQWLLKQPVCPVCRCDLVASLESIHR